MHCAFEGCVKRLGELWFDSKFSNKRFSISDLVAVVDYRLCSIKPPHYVARRPRSIKQHFSHWKASEFKNWGLYFTLPVLQDVLYDEYLEHYKLFLLGIYMFCQEKVTDDMINLGEKCLNEFVKRYEELYGIKYMTCNVHSLKHLHLIIRRFGPLWTTSCFLLEDLNGKLKAMVRGSKSPHLQIVSNLNMYMVVYTYKNNWLKDSEEAREFCDSLLAAKKKLKLKNIGRLLFAVGSSSRILSHNIIRLLVEQNWQNKNIFVFLKFYKNDILYTSQNADINKKTESFYVKYISGNTIGLGSVQNYIKLSDCTCKKLCSCPGKSFAVLKKIEIENPYSVNLNDGTLSFIHRVINISKETVLVDT